MWSTDTYWFDVAIVMAVFAAGNILFGRFEEHKPRILRLAKLALALAIALALSWLGMRWLGLVLIGIAGIAAGYIHGVWLPRRGVNGWTGEPRERYLELVAAGRRRRHR